MKEKEENEIRARELCEQGGGPALSSLSHSSRPVPNKPYGFCGPEKAHARGC